MRRNLLFWAAGLAVVACAMAASARQDEETAEKKGVEATYRNEIMRFDLDGKTGKLYYRCENCGQWHTKNLTFVEKTTLTWKGSGDEFTGWVYKARGEARWYFLSEDAVTIKKPGGKTLERYPIASSTTSANKNFYRILTTGGTTREIRAFVNVPETTEPEKDAKDPETLKDTGEKKK